MRSILCLFLLAYSLLLSGQTGYQEKGNNPIFTAADYLQSAPDARSVGMGETGVASSPDIYSSYWNPAKYAFLDDRFGIAVSYSDYLWMNKMWKWADHPGIKTGFNTLHSFYRIDERSSLSFSFTYYNALYEMNLGDMYGNIIGTYIPYDMNLGAGYSFRFSNTFSAGINARYLYSNMVKDKSIYGTEIGPAQSVAFDLAVYYQKAIKLGSRDGEIRWGIDLSNIGMKMSYLENDDYEDFLPANLRLGAGLTYHFDEKNSLSFQFDANKLQVPTPPYYLRDSLGSPVYDDDGNPVVAKGMDPDVPVLKGMIQSWYDAPGGFEEEMHEWAINGGFEYRYKTILSARTGFNYQHESKGLGWFYTAGAGFKVGIFGMDLGIKVPLDRKITDLYISIFYLRTSIAISVPQK